MAGAGLLMDGLRRGGKLGVAEDAGGGALIGVLFFLIVVVLMPFALGPDLALLEYAASVKLWLFSLILARILLPASGLIAQTAALLILMALIAIAIVLVESFTARVRLIKVPQLLIGAGGVALLGFFISVSGILSSVKGI